MKHLLFVAALFVAGGCKKGGGATPEACAKIATKAVANLPGGADADAIKDTLKGIYTQHCVADKWSADVMSCYETAADMPAMRACREKLPADQAERMKGDISAVMKAQMGAMGGPGGPMMGHPGMGGPPPAGDVPPAAAVPPPPPAAGSAP